MSTDFYTFSILPYAGIIIKICRAYTNTHEDFEDCYQEACLQIWKSRHNYKGLSQWQTWIYKITLNVCLTLQKKSKSNRRLFDTTPTYLEVTDENRAFADEDLNHLFGAIKKLSEIDRAVIVLYLEEKSYKEIAAIMGTNVNNIGVRVKRIKERLKKMLDGKIN